MSTFPVSPRTHIVNGVLVTGFSDTKRHNGLQGTNSKEDLYRSLSKMSSPVPKTISPSESVSSNSDIPCNRNQRHNCPTPTNTNRPAVFAQERRKMAGKSANVTHCDHGLVLDPRENELETSEYCNSSHCQSRSRGNKLHSRVEQGTNMCCEETNFIQRAEWESGDHHRSTSDNSPTHNGVCCLCASNTRSCNVPVACNCNHLKYPHQEISAKNALSDPRLEECRESIHHGHLNHSARREPPLEECQENVYQGRLPSSTLEECQEHIHQGRSPCSARRDPTLAECQESVNQPHSPQITRRYPVVEGCQEYIHHHHPCVHPHDQILSDDKAIYRTSNSTRLHEYDDSGASAETCHVLVSSEDACDPQNVLIEPILSSPTSNEHSEFNKYIKSEMPRHSEEYFGYPPQRGINRNQYLMPADEESSGVLNAGVQHGEQINMQELQMCLQRKGKREHEAGSVAEIFSHPILEIHPDYSKTSAPQHISTLINPVSEEAVGYPAQLATLGKSRYTVHKTHGNEAQCPELLQYEYNTGPTETTGANYPSLYADGEFKQIHNSPRNESTHKTEFEGHESSCGKSHLQDQHLIEGERERVLVHNSIQNTVYPNSKHCKYNSCNVPRNAHSLSLEPYCQNHHYSEMSDGKMCRIPFQNRKPADERECSLLQTDKVAQRQNKEVRREGNLNSCRSSPCQEEESYRAETENQFHAAGCLHNSNPVPRTSDLETCPDSYKIVPDKSEEVLQDLDKFQAGVVKENCHTHGAQVPTTEPYNNCEVDHPILSQICEYPKATEGLQEPEAASCHVNNPDDDTVPCNVDQLCSPDKCSSELRQSSRRRITELHLRRNGIDYEDQVVRNVENNPNYHKENNEVRAGVRKQKPLILQDSRQSTSRQNKCTIPPKDNTFSARASDEKKVPSFTSKSRIPKAKEFATLSSYKSNKTSGNPQRPMRTTGQIQNSK